MAKQEEFFNLSHCQLATLISRDDLNVRCESEVFHACINWVKYDCEQRRFYVQALLRAVRCHSLTPHFLQMQLQKCEILQSDSRCKDYLVKIFQELTLHKPTQVMPNKYMPLSASTLLYSICFSYISVFKVNPVILPFPVPEFGNL